MSRAAIFRQSADHVFVRFSSCQLIAQVINWTDYFWPFLGFCICNSSVVGALIKNSSLKTGNKTFETKLFVTLLKSRRNEWFSMHITFLREKKVIVETSLSRRILAVF